MLNHPPNNNNNISHHLEYILLYILKSLAVIFFQICFSTYSTISQYKKKKKIRIVFLQPDVILDFKCLSQLVHDLRPDIKNIMFLTGFHVLI